MTVEHIKIIHMVAWIELLEKIYCKLMHVMACFHEKYLSKYPQILV